MKSYCKHSWWENFLKIITCLFKSVDKFCLVWCLLSSSPCTSVSLPPLCATSASFWRSTVQVLLMGSPRNWRCSLEWVFQPSARTGSELHYPRIEKLYWEALQYSQWWQYCNVTEWQMLWINSLNDFLRKMKYSTKLPATFLTPQVNSLGCSCQSHIVFN